FKLQQPALARQSAAVTRQRAVGANDPMAGDHDADTVAMIGGANDAGVRTIADCPGQITVTAGPAIGNALQLGPDRFVKSGAGGIQSEFEYLSAAVEIVPHLLLYLVQAGVVLPAQGKTVAAVQIGDFL